MGVQIAFDFAAPSASEAPGPQAPGNDPATGTTDRADPRAAGGQNYPGQTSRGRTDRGRTDRGQAGRAATGAVPTAPAERQRWSRHELEQRLREQTGLELSLLVTDNERTMISTRRQAGRFVVRVHHMFQHADVDVVTALARYLDKSDRDAGAVLGRYIETQRDRIRRAKPRRVRLRPLGEHHDLQAIFDSLNRRYFDGAVTARITWARRTSVAQPTGGNGKRGSRRSIKLGSYSSRDGLVRIHPVLDADWVPEMFVAFIVYHEMLHEVVPPRRAGDRRAFHGPEFRARERRFTDYDRAIAWEQRHLRRLLRG